MVGVDKVVAGALSSRNTIKEEAPVITKEVKAEEPKQERKGRKRNDD